MKQFERRRLRARENGLRNLNEFVGVFEESEAQQNDNNAIAAANIAQSSAIEVEFSVDRFVANSDVSIQLYNKYITSYDTKLKEYGLTSNKVYVNDAVLF